MKTQFSHLILSGRALLLFALLFIGFLESTLQAQRWTQLFSTGQLPDAASLNLNNAVFDPARSMLYSIKKHQGSQGYIYSFNVSTGTYNLVPATDWPGELHSFVHDPARRRILSWIAGRDPVYAIPDSGGAWVRVGGNDGRDFESFGCSSYWNPLTSSPGFFAGYGYFSTKNWIYEVGGSTGPWIQKKANVSNLEPYKRLSAQMVQGSIDSIMYMFSGLGNQDGTTLFEYVSDNDASSKMATHAN